MGRNIGQDLEDEFRLLRYIRKNLSHADDRNRFIHEALWDFMTSQQACMMQVLLSSRPLWYRALPVRAMNLFLTAKKLCQGSVFWKDLDLSGVLWALRQFCDSHDADLAWNCSSEDRSWSRAVKGTNSAYDSDRNEDPGNAVRLTPPIPTSWVERRQTHHPELLGRNNIIPKQLKSIRELLETSYLSSIDESEIKDQHMIVLPHAFHVVFEWLENPDFFKILNSARKDHARGVLMCQINDVYTLKIFKRL